MRFYTYVAFFFFKKQTLKTHPRGAFFKKKCISMVRFLGCGFIVKLRERCGFKVKMKGLLFFGFGL